MKTNELKRGDWVRLRNGWYAEVWDNKKGNTRVCDVYGFAHEAGSVYSHDIVERLDGPDGKVIAQIEHTPAQLKLKKQVESWF